VRIGSFLCTCRFFSARTYAFKERKSGHDFTHLILNLSLLVALTVVSGFVEKRWPRHTRRGVLIQGAVFGLSAILGMLRPLNLGPGLIFDGRSVMTSLCALFFGPWAALVAGGMALACRLGLGGMGMLTGSLVIVTSTVIGLLGYYRFRPDTRPPSVEKLYLFGVIVHLAMLAAMFTLPGGAGPSVVARIGLPVLLLYPLATILAGKILFDQVEAGQHLEALRQERDILARITETSPVGIMLLDRAGTTITFANPQAGRILGLKDDRIVRHDYNDPAWQITDFSGQAFPVEQLPFVQARDRRTDL
jgi:PAS domain-containing protein